MLRTERGPLRPLWRTGYSLAERGYAAWLRGGDRRASVYARAARNPVYGLSDVDLAVVVPADPGAPGRARERVLARRERLARRLPWLSATLFDLPYVFEEDDLAEAAPAPVQPYALYFGARAHADRARLAENPGLYGPVAGWRRVAGPARPLPPEHRDAQHRRLAAWLQLQGRWRWVLQATGFPPGPRSADLCVKAVVDPLSAWLWLRHGERAEGRRDALERGLRRLPEEEPTLHAALALERALPRRPQAPLEEFTGHLVRLSARVADLLAAQVADAGTTEVRLLWDGPDDLALTPNDAFRLAPVLGDGAAPRRLPLVDWRALVGASLRRPGWSTPAPPDETIAPLELDPARLGDLTAAAAAGNDGPYAALRAGPLLVLASIRWPRTQVRAIHCPLDDPVSFALLEGREVAAYPDVAGWSAVDVAGRAVVEHGAWLAAPGELAPGEALGILAAAARAARFLESAEAGAPELPLTAGAALRSLGADVGAEAAAAHQRFRREGVPPPASTVPAVREAVARLPPYAGCGRPSADRRRR